MVQQLLELRRELKEMRWENRSLHAHSNTIPPLGQANELDKEVELIPKRNEYARAENIVVGVQQDNARAEA